MIQTKKYIPLEQLADFHQVSVSLITEFANFGLVEIIHFESTPCILSRDMEKCERALRLYKELGVNKEGIEIVLQMRERLTEMQQEINRLKHLLKKHEESMSNIYSDTFFEADYPI